MSTWISKAAAFLMLAACVPAGGSGPATGPVPFLDGEIRAAAPQGYCVDTGASHQSGDGAVILMGRCGGVTSVPPALIAASVGAPGSSAVLKSGARALSDYFLSNAGRAALARDGRAASVRVSKTAVADGALILHVSDRAVGDYWRAIIGLRGRLVTLSVSAPEGGTLTEDEGRRILGQAITVMRRANPATST